MFCVNSYKNQSVFNISGTPRNCKKSLVQKIMHSAADVCEKKATPGVWKGHPQPGLASVIQISGWCGNCKTYKNTMFFKQFCTESKKTQCFSIDLRAPFWHCLARGGHLPRPAVSHLSALCALIFLRPSSEATKMSSRPYKSGPLNFQGELSAL